MLRPGASNLQLCLASFISRTIFCVVVVVVVVVVDNLLPVPGVSQLEHILKLFHFFHIVSGQGKTYCIQLTATKKQMV